MKADFFSSNFLSSFAYTREPFAILGNRLFTLREVKERPKPKQNCLQINHDFYELRESDKISNLEEEFFRLREDELKDYLFERIVHRENDVSKGLKQIDNDYQNLQTTTLETFILVDVFNAYFNRENSTERKVNSVTENFDNSLLEKLYSQENVLPEQLKNKKILSLKNQVYELTTKISRPDRLLNFRGKNYSLRMMSNLRDLVNDYEHNLLVKVGKFVEEHAGTYQMQLKNLQQQRKELDRLLILQANNSFIQEGNLSFSRKGKTDYTLKLRVPDFFIKRDGEYYPFPEAVIGLELGSRNNQVKVKGIPNVYNRPYNHPFVWSTFDSGICYGNFNFAEHFNLNFQHYLSCNEETASLIANMLRQGERIMTSAYINNSFAPVNSIERCSTSVGRTREKAERYAQRRGLKMEVFDNDQA